jgi:hypothetical protein
MDTFYPLTPQMGDKLRKANLSAAEWSLWSYLATLDPSGECYVQLPDILTVLSDTNISKATFYRAIAKFQKEGLFDFQSCGFSIRNRLARSEGGFDHE